MLKPMQRTEPVLSLMDSCRWSPFAPTFRGGEISCTPLLAKMGFLLPCPAGSRSASSFTTVSLRSLTEQSASMSSFSSRTNDVKFSAAYFSIAWAKSFILPASILRPAAYS